MKSYKGHMENIPYPYTIVQMTHVLLRRPRKIGSRYSCGKNFNLKNGRQCGKCEVSIDVRSLIDVENDQ
jgi:hypothetical protein